MLTNRPAEPGMAVADVETPALLVERGALGRNIAALAAYVTGGPGGRAVALRPHAKTHKCADISRLQVAAGARGVCCQTVGEVEALVAGGLADVMLANEVATPGKADRLARAAMIARVSACVDDLRQIELLAAAAGRHGAVIGVLVEIDVGGGRCGVVPGEAALALALRVREHAGLRFEGLQAYHGPAQHLRTPSERAAAIRDAAGAAGATAKLLVEHGFEHPRVTGAGTGTFEFEATSGVFDELQCGSYVFMDADYGLNTLDDASPAPRFEQSLHVLSSVVSTAGAGRVITDAGLKAISFDSGPPVIVGQPGLAYVGPSDEHSTLAGSHDLVPGDKVWFVPGHCDPTVNLHDWLVVHENGRVVDLWEIARGL